MKIGDKVAIVNGPGYLNGMLGEIVKLGRSGGAVIEFKTGRRYFFHDDELLVIEERDIKKPSLLRDNLLTTLFISVCIAFFFSTVSCEAKAEVVFTPFFEVGAAHRDCALSDPMLCKRYSAGSDTPGYLGAGVEISNCKYFFGADTCTIQWIHQSYVDRGVPFNDNPEAQLDSYGMMFRWKIDSWSFKL